MEAAVQFPPPLNIPDGDEYGITYGTSAHLYLRLLLDFLPPANRSFAVFPIGNLSPQLSGLCNVKLYSFKELKIATNNFSTENMLGEGGFGCVYKAKLRNGTMAAVKVLSSASKQGLKEFLTEIRIISDIDHEDLVKLYGCCVEGNRRILVYNYLENNSLAQTLLGERWSFDSGERHGNNVHFDWSTRVNICVRVARGIAYLHEEVRPHIIHRDIKASNILLDGNLNPKISDFGLAKLIPPNITHISTHVAGTRGYLAPEYAIRGQVTRRSDVYSFGVLLLEIVSGRPNRTFDEQYLLETAWELYERNELVYLVDAALEGNFDAEQARRFLEVGLLCTQDSPDLRPSMSSVLKMLTGEEAVVMEAEGRITRPGLITDFMAIKTRNNNKKAETTKMTTVPSPEILTSSNLSEYNMKCR
ncbi:hypothetical protein M569_13052 [Genlisea aurea]|uniref:Protein kinase domain-containing protein n=1 Tax=Genlisea aurea TaxID=192259 RepID=S8DPM1_9LAMI|nr:hypothetical protein M569_13052 [Genlisea aurea]